MIDGSPCRAEGDPSRRFRILLAEDHPINREIVVAILEPKGYAVTTVDDGAAAVRRFRREDFDLVLLDVEMPEMGGAEAARRIREREGAGPRIPILALTAEADGRGEDRRPDFDEIIAKPIRRALLLEKVERWLTGGRRAGAGPGTTPAAGGSSLFGEPPTAGDPPPIDYRTAGVEFGDPGTLAATLRWFLTETAGRLPEMRREAERGGRTAVRAAAHRLRGAAANLEAAPLAEAARRLEEDALEDRDLRAALEEVEDRFEALRTYAEAHAEEWEASR